MLDEDRKYQLVIRNTNSPTVCVTPERVRTGRTGNLSRRTSMVSTPAAAAEESCLTAAELSRAEAWMESRSAFSLVRSARVSAAVPSVSTSFFN